LRPRGRGAQERENDDAAGHEKSRSERFSSDESTRDTHGLGPSTMLR
jgi:hypothetical protein